jgi:hypothetical protein
VVGIRGSVASSTIAAGLLTTDGIFKNGDDVIAPGAPSTITNLTILGTADNDSYFAASAFTAGRFRTPRGSMG